MTIEEDGDKIEMEVPNENKPLVEEQIGSHESEDNFRKTHHFQPIKEKSIWTKIGRNATCNKACLLGLIPILSWLPRYDFKNCFVGDVVSGLTVSVLQIPHGLAFAPLGGQAPVSGLYMAVFPIIVYVIFGTSRHLSLGMQAILIMMVGKIVETHSGFQNGLSPRYSALEVGVAVTFTTGLWQVLLSALQLGSLCVMLSSSLVSGLTSGAAIHIIFIQLKHIFGIQVKMSSGPLKLIYTSIDFVKNVPDTNYLAFGISIAFMIFLFVYNDYLKPILAKKCRIPIPMEFVLIGIGIGISEYFDLQGNYGIKTVGTVPGGLPEPFAPPFTLIPSIAIDCLSIALINISINVSLAKLFASKGGYQVNENQELLAYGLSNMLGGFFQCLPVCAALSRSMMQFALGGKTMMAHAVCLLSVLVMLLSIGPFFEKVPLCVLAAIVVVTVKALFMQMTEFPRIWRSSKLDGTVWLVTFMSVVLIDIDYGIGIGLATSLLTLVLNNVQSQVLVLGQIPNKKYFIDSRLYQTAVTNPKVLLLKIIGGVNFYNSVRISGKLQEAFVEFCDNSQEMSTFVIVDFAAVPYIDPVGVKEILNLYNNIKERNSEMIITSCSPDVFSGLEKCKYFVTFPQTHCMISIEAALKFLHEQK